MHIVVCMKQVPDSAQIRVHPVTNTIMRQGVPTIINPYDLFAIEEALRLRQKFGGAVCGGVRQWETLVLGDQAMVQSEALDAIRQTNGNRFILGTGCVVPITAPAGNIAAARRTVNQIQ